MKKFSLAIVLLALVGQAVAVEINVCIAEKGKNNKMYQNLATTRTRLMCEVGDKNKRYTLPQLYADNWELVKVMDASIVDKKYRAPLYYFERIKAPKKKKKWNN